MQNLSAASPLSSAARSCLWALLVASPLGCSDESHRLGGEYELSDGLRVGTCGNGAELESVDRMEDGDGTIERIAGRGGVWLSFNDGFGEQEPTEKEETFPMEKLKPPRAGSRFAVRSKGVGFTDWGAGVGFELNNQQAYDLSRYAGISFWARRAEGEPFTLRVTLPDAATAPRGKQCEGTFCNDHFGANLTPGVEFVRYSYQWSDLAQGTFGNPKPESVNTSAVYSVHFQVPPRQDFDFTIDDIMLLCRSE
jgi:hypothetical protein